MHGHGFLALEVFDKMQCEHLKACEQTLVSVLKACGLVGEVQKLCDCQIMNDLQAWGWANYVGIFFLKRKKPQDGATGTSFQLCVQCLVCFWVRCDQFAEDPNRCFLYNQFCHANTAMGICAGQSLWIFGTAQDKWFLMCVCSISSARCKYVSRRAPPSC